ncbi:hypothetical protein J8273_8258 [Carpediemonas membranifera]|uniref:Transmembrane protein n=1 Tax=Carpediemonas membranifera TaxID=201153 RepID=A0A8J6DZ42_9EUKA|nr:hypothetical protein J8273_8258 [Carpediemonas membranifera]|eukprot:KAG9390218.1 hypothetical protein J8273_8258 [Carpediemonas membranifera]
MSSAVFRDKAVSSTDDIKRVSIGDVADFEKIIRVLKNGPIGTGVIDWFFLYGFTAAFIVIISFMSFIFFEMVKGVLQEITARAHFMIDLDVALEVLNGFVRFIVVVVTSLLGHYLYCSATVCMLRIAKGEKLTLKDFYLTPASNMGSYLATFWVSVGFTILLTASLLFGVPVVGLFIFWIPPVVVPFFTFPHWFLLSAEQKTPDFLSHVKVSAMAAVRNWQVTLLTWGAWIASVVACVSVIVVVMIFQIIFMFLLGRITETDPMHTVGGVFVYTVFVVIYDIIVVLFVAGTGPFLGAMNVIAHGEIFLMPGGAGDLEADVPTTDFTSLTAAEYSEPSQLRDDSGAVASTDEVEAPSAPVVAPEVDLAGGYNVVDGDEPLI